MTEQPVRVEIDKQDLQDVFDIAVGSLDFGSGFLDKGATIALRRIARALGVDPQTATPSNVIAYFAHAYEAGTGTREGMCGTWAGSPLGKCGRPESDPIHRGVSFDDPGVES